MSSSKHSRGFTLIELMIVVAILAILAALAYPAYIRHTISSRRAAATACLTELSQFMERYYTTNLTYTGAALPTNTACQRDLEAFYTFAVSAVTGSTYTLQATPQGPQTRDTECGTLSLDHRGERTVSGGADVAQCW
jgi:type IV pilus assembly protein PilE